MPISIRLDPDTEIELRRRLDLEGVPLSDFVRDAIREKLGRPADPVTPYSIGEPLFGRYSSGATDLSARRKEILRDRFRDRHSR